MTTSGIVLVLCSACLHATWNLLSKTGGGPTSFLTRALYYSTLCYLPLFVIFQFRIDYTPFYFGALAASGLFAGLYFICLAKAYDAGRISIAYPIARSFPILVLVWAGLLFHERPSAQAVAGIALIVGGCFLLPLKRFRNNTEEIGLRHYWNRSSIWALGAALATSAYSMIDKAVSANINSANTLEATILRVNYVYLQNAISLAVMLVFARTSYAGLNRSVNGKALICGLIFLVSYSLILVAFTHNPVAYVVSFRQLSIVIAAIVSMLVIEREFSWPRLFGVSTIFVGVVLVGLS